LVDDAFDETRAICVFNAEEAFAVILFREDVVIESRTKTAEVE